MTSAQATVGAEAVELTLGRLLQERLLIGARVLSGEQNLDRPVRWCHPFLDLLGDQGADLASSVALADDRELDARRWSALLQSGCAAVFVRAAQSFKVPKAGPGAPVVVWVPASMSRRSLVEL